jgi:pimeloyl-ACP methyl ester carboxylesterase
VVRDDLRGMGYSERFPCDMALDALVLDIEAVAENLGLTRFKLAGVTAAAAVAMAYAAAHPEQVSRLVLLEPFPRGRAWSDSSPVRRLTETIAALAEDDWSVFTQALAGAVTSFAVGEQAHELAVGLERGASPNTFLAYENAIRSLDLAPLLPLVRMPALVLHNPRLADRLRAGRGRASFR